MKNYEGVFILKSRDEQRAEKAIANILDTIKKNKGTIVKEDNWGKRQAAYPIKKQKEGIFLKLDFSVDPSKIRPIENACKLNGDILRTSIFKKEADEI